MLADRRSVRLVIGAIGLAAALAVSSGCSSGGAASESTTTSTSQATTASVPAAVPPKPESAGGDRNDAYVAAFIAQCDQIWAIADDGVLSDPDDSSTVIIVDDCYADIDPAAGDLLPSVDEATAVATQEAQDTAAALSSTRRLCNKAGECWPS